MSKQSNAELRRAEALRRRNALYRVEILVNQDGTVEAKGFPENVGDALNVMSAGMRAVAGFFIKQAFEAGEKKGREDEENAQEWGRMPYSDAPDSESEVEQ